jgi:hypothetical protein
MAYPANQLDELNEVSAWQSANPIQIIPSPQVLRDFVRAEADQALALRDKSVGHFYGTDQSSLPSLGPDLEVFGQWPSVAGTLWNKLLQMTGFDPSNVDYNSSVFAGFKTKFSTSPFWNGLEFNIAYRDATLRVTDYRQLVDAIIDLVEVGISGVVRAGIISNIRKIAQLASLNVRTQRKDTLAQNSTFGITNGRLYVFFLYGTVEMTARQGKYTVIDQAMRIVRGYGVLDFDFCKRHADSILRYDSKSVEEWEGQAAANSQPENQSGGWPPDA